MLTEPRSVAASQESVTFKMKPNGYQPVKELLNLRAFVDFADINLNS